MNSFLNACGLSGPFYLVVRGPGEQGGETHSLQQPYAVIGRDPRADIAIEDHELSRRHLYIQVVQGRAFWIDLDSRIGTKAHDGTTQKSGWLENDRPLSIGPFTIARPAAAHLASVVAPRPLTAKESPLLALSYGRNPMPNVALEFLNGPTRGELWPMHRVMSLIGSSKGCKFRLTDRSVAPFHASLLRTAAGLWIIDLRGGSSIIVNETPVRCVRISDGDILGIGRYRIRVRYQMWERTTRDRSAIPLPDSHSTYRPTSSAGSELSLIDPSSSAMAYEGEARAFPGSAIDVPSGVPNVEMVPLEATFPTRLEESAISQAILVPLVNQFSMMQQQMFDQFQQSMGMLVQMFSTMHRDQMEVIHEELGRLKELTSELHALKVELGARPMSGQVLADPPSIPPAAASSVPDLEEIERMLANAKRGVSAATPPAVAAPMTATLPTPGGAAVASMPSPAPPPTLAGPAFSAQQVEAITGVGTPADSLASSRPAADRPNQSLHVRPPQPATTKPAGQQPTAARAPQAAAPTRAQPPTAAMAGGEDPNSVAWLHQRIMTLQRERETRWQKILKLLPGHS